MLVLGIDPGTATTGYGLVRDTANGIEMVAYGAILTTPDQTPAERLQSLYDQLNELILLHRPDAASVEKLFFYQNVTTAIGVAQARGVILLALNQHHLNLGEYTPLEVKQSVVGYGRAEKKQVQAMVHALLNLNKTPKPDDAADALAIAICHLHSNKINALMQ